MPQGPLEARQRLREADLHLSQEVSVPVVVVCVFFGFVGSICPKGKRDVLASGCERGVHLDAPVSVYTPPNPNPPRFIRTAAQREQQPAQESLS